MASNNSNGNGLKNNGDPAKRIFCKKTPGQRAADRASRMIGSWIFVMFQTIFILSWITLNVVLYLKGWDPYPFVFLNLILSVVATYSAPVILMSQNREAERDRMRAANDLATDRKALREIDEIKEMLKRLEKKIGR